MLTLTHHPVPVTIVGNGWYTLSTWVNLIAPLAGILIALGGIAVAIVAIRRANEIGRDADEALIEERGKTFELTILTRILEIAATGGGGKQEAVQGLLLMLKSHDGKEDLPSFRQQVQEDVIPSNEPLHEHFDEFQQAVNLRMASAPRRRRRGRKPAGIRSRLARGLRHLADWLDPQPEPPGESETSRTTTAA
jgi:hypothetical protein